MEASYCIVRIIQQFPELIYLLVSHRCPRDRRSNLSRKCFPLFTHSIHNDPNIRFQSSTLLSSSRLSLDYN